MHRSKSHRATTNRSIQPNPILYVAVSGDMTWDRWRELSSREQTLRQIDLAALSIAERVPTRSTPGYQDTINDLLASLAMEELLDKLQQLPSELQPVRGFSPLKALVFCQALSARIVRAAVRR